MHNFYKKNNTSASLITCSNFPISAGKETQKINKNGGAKKIEEVVKYDEEIFVLFS